MDRKQFIKHLGLGTAGSLLLAAQPSILEAKSSDLFFKISLAEWSFNKELFAGKMDNLDFAKRAKTEFGIDAIEFVDQFFMDKAKDTAYLNELNKRASDYDVKHNLIMIDGEGDLGDTDSKKRKQAVENHHKWVDAAAHLNCWAIRVNARGSGDPKAASDAAVQSLNELLEYSLPRNIKIMVENHGGFSSNGKWLAGVMKQVNNKNCGTLPDFGGFGKYDKYQGVKDTIPYALDVSAKTFDFDKNGNETTIDYDRMLKIIHDSGYHGYFGIEFEGTRLSEEQGVRDTKKLLERLGPKYS